MEFMINRENSNDEQKNIYREMIAKIKNQLKEFAIIQKKLKKDESNYTRQYNRYKITAILNFYLEIRGKKYRHAKNNSQYLNCWVYTTAMKKLQEEFKDTLSLLIKE